MVSFSAESTQKNPQPPKPKTKQPKKNPAKKTPNQQRDRQPNLLLPSSNSESKINQWDTNVYPENSCPSLQQLQACRNAVCWTVTDRNS